MFSVLFVGLRSFSRVEVPHIDIKALWFPDDGRLDNLITHGGPTQRDALVNLKVKPMSIPNEISYIGNSC
jgi:hypothetical protein